MKFPSFLDIRPLFFPQLCLACRKDPPTKGEGFCIECYLELPFTDHFENKENAFVKHFWGRIKVEHGAALWSIGKDNIPRKMIHGLKYRRKKYNGYEAGRMAGLAILKSRLFNNIDLIVPVPLTEKKKRQRNYNQSAIFAEGISQHSSIPFATDLLVKIKETPSQTSKSRSERLENVQGSFQVTDVNQVALRHILLVDDVITTGATLESCAKTLLEIPGVTVSMMTIGIAIN